MIKCTDAQVVVLLVLLPASVGAAAFKPSMSMQFSLTLGGLTASFYTYQQSLPEGVPSYILHDSWVQHVYSSADGAAAVFNVALISHQAIPARHGVTHSASTHTRGQCTLLPGHQRQCTGTEAVAVQTGGIGELARWFEQHHLQLAPFKRPVLSTLAPLPPTIDTTSGLPALGNSRHGVAQQPQEAPCNQIIAPYVRQDDQDDPQQDGPAFPELRQASDDQHGALARHDTESLRLRREPDNPATTQPAATAPGSVQEPPPALQAACRHRSFQVYLGMSIPLVAGGGSVSSQQLNRFLAEHVSSRVQGFTLLQGRGFWQGEQEATAVLEVVSDAQDIAQAITEIAEAYKTAFAQEAVMVKEAACPSGIQFV